MLSLSPEEAVAAYLRGALVVDVRSAARFAGDALPGSVNVAFEEVAAGALPAVASQTTEVLVVCEVGSFSELAAAYLQAAGIAGARSARGGLRALRPLLSGRDLQGGG